MLPRVVLKKGREKPVLAFHPWVFSGAIEKLPKDGEAGGLVDVCTSTGKFIARGYMNPRSQITVRLLTFRDEAIDSAFLRSRLARALSHREALTQGGHTNACRLVNSEGDGLPGLAVDRYAEFLVVRFLTLGMAKRRNEVVGLLADLAKPRGIFERPDEAACVLEGFSAHPASLAGEDPPERLEIRENGLTFLANVREGQKSGFYLDQRENRAWVAPFSAGLSVLNCFSYSGAFSVYALKAGARRAVSVDASERALQLAHEQFRANGLDPEQHDFVQGDAFEYLRRGEELFDLIILDPPAFCKSKAQVNAAARGYKDLQLRSIKLLRPGGLLFASSCSHFISPDLFMKILFAAAKDAGRALDVLGMRAHPLDHPVSVYHPEGQYLKAVLARAGDALR